MGNKARRKDHARLEKRRAAFDSMKDANHRGRGLMMHRPGSLKK